MPTRSKTRHELFRNVNGTVLDIGCGIALESIRLAKNNNCEVYCLDINKDHLMQSREIAQNYGIDSKIDFILADANHLNFKSSLFDLIMFKAALHHLKIWKCVLSRVKEWIKPGGMIYLEEPLKTNPIATLTVYLYYTLAGSFLNIHERPDPDQWPFDPRELICEIRNQFVIKHISYHLFISNLFKKAAKYAKLPILSKIFKRLVEITKLLDSYVQSHPIWQRYCSVIIIQAQKNDSGTS